MLDLAFDLDLGARVESADRENPGSVFVPGRQVEQQVLQRVYTQLAERILQLWPDAVKFSQRQWRLFVQRFGLQSHHAFDFDPDTLWQGGDLYRRPGWKRLDEILFHDPATNCLISN